MRGGWFRLRTVRIAAALVVVSLLGILVLPLLIPVDRYRPLLVWAIESGTGRSVQIDALKLALVPTVRIRVVGFRMKNPRGFPDGDALAASSINVGIDPHALLSRRLNVTYIAPADLQVNVLRAASGRTNFADPIPSKSTASKAAASRPGGVPFFTVEHVGDVILTHAAVSLADVVGAAPAKPSFTLRVVHGRIGGIDPQVLDWAKRLAVVADLRDAQLATTLLAKPVTFRSGELTLKDGAARATFAASAGPVDVTGTAALVRLAPLSMTFALVTPELDLKNLAQLIDVGAQERAAEPVPNRLVAHGTVKAAKMSFAPLVGTQFRGQLEVYTRAVRIPSCTFSGYGGTVAGSMSLDGAVGSPATVTLLARGLRVAQTLAAIGLGATNVTGTLDAGFGITTLLARNPGQSTTATGTFTVRNGSFPGLDFKSALAQTARLANLNVPAGDTHFQSFGGDLRIANGRGASRHLALVATGMAGTGSGSFGFDRTVAYRGTAVLDALAPTSAGAGNPLLAAIQQLASASVRRAIGGMRVRLPFTLNGTFDHPQFALSGTPQFVTGGGSSPPLQAPPLPAPVQELLKLIPGL
jgi:hypothetical protein